MQTPACMADVLNDDPEINSEPLSLTLRLDCDFFDQLHRVDVGEVYSWNPEVPEGAD
jgi:hypothetical protein